MWQGARQVIRVVGLIAIANRRILLTRSKGKDGFYLPGGKVERGESDRDALTREIREELGCDLVRQEIVFHSRYVAQAFGEPEGVLVSMNTYNGKPIGTPLPRAEIAEARFFTSEEYQQMPSRAPAIDALLSDLRAHAVSNPGAGRRNTCGVRAYVHSIY